MALPRWVKPLKKVIPICDLKALFGAHAVKGFVIAGVVENFALVRPASSNDNCGVYLYLDEVFLLICGHNHGPISSISAPISPFPFPKPLSSSLTATLHRHLLLPVLRSLSLSFIMSLSSIFPSLPLSLAPALPLRSAPRISRARGCRATSIIRHARHARRAVGRRGAQVGLLKRLAPNPRAGELARACGFDGAAFYGDVYLGRTCTR
jgi:hypothetical protein